MRFGAGSAVADGGSGGDGVVILRVVVVVDLDYLLLWNELDITTNFVRRWRRLTYRPFQLG